MAETCCDGGNDVMILTCSGGSNVGQMSNQAAVELTQEGFGKMFCLAGIGGKLSGFVQPAKDVPVMVAIDGCQVGCAKEKGATNGGNKSSHRCVYPGTPQGNQPQGTLMLTGDPNSPGAGERTRG